MPNEFDKYNILTSIGFKSQNAYDPPPTHLHSGDLKLKMPTIHLPTHLHSGDKLNGLEELVATAE